MMLIGRLLNISFLCLCSTSVSWAVIPDAGEEPHNPWRTDSEKALVELKGKAKVILLSADWCHWCEQLQEESAVSADVQKHLQQLPGIVLNVDHYPALMPYYGIQGLPSLVLVNAKEEVITVRTGYLPSVQLAAMLNKWRTIKNKKGIIPSGLYPEMEYDMLKSEKGIGGAIERLGKGTSGQRSYLRERLAEEKEVDVLLWPLLNNASLSVRVDASSILARRHGNVNIYDAFAKPSLRTAGAAKWKQSVKAKQLKEKEKQPSLILK
jgi:thioredoxin-related protein